ncbi:MAG: hypothetical protein K6C05_09125 [Anaerovibrio sp.]|uniref:glycosyltransferase family 8 protein n=1 Tax=Anaerovibrio sp. TaxID=1872532 RepID=UPI0025CEE89B|nr:glycosyltransferase [Anaerovibrio sp.]MCR5176994.1 hypothetical protein [Anaerovibrio sp.]
MIHICYTLSDKEGNYSKFVAASMCSVLKNTEQPVIFHLLNDNTLSEENKENFRSLVHSHGQQINFYNVPQLIGATLEKGKSILPAGFLSKRYTQVNLYRLAIAEVLPRDIDKVIFLDADTIVNVDINKLWLEPTGDSGIAAVSDWSVLDHYGKTADIKPGDSFLFKNGLASVKTVFNAGVLLMNLDILRQQGSLLLKGLKFLSANNGRWEYFDNDILIAFYSKVFHHLPWNYNIRVIWARGYGGNKVEEGIYHYVGRDYGINTNDSFYALFLKFLMQTPWIDDRIIYNGYHLSKAYTFHQARIRFSKIQQIFNKSRNKKLVFMGLEVDEVRLRNDFALGEDDRYMFLPPGGKLPFIDSSSYIYYLVFWSDYAEIKSLLEQRGLKEFENFADGTLLMPECTGDLSLDELNYLWRL